MFTSFWSYAVFFALVICVRVEKVLRPFCPNGSVHSSAFPAAIENGGEFTAETRLLLSHLSSVRSSL